MDIKTSRLHIRDLYESDWPEMKNIFVDFNQSKYAAFDRPLPKDDSESKSLTKQFADSGLFFAVHLLENNKMIGYICFHKNGDTLDLGYCFHSASCSKQRSTSSIANSFLYCLIIAFFGFVRMATSMSRLKPSNVQTTGRRPKNSGIMPNSLKSSMVARFKIFLS